MNRRALIAAPALLLPSLAHAQLITPGVQTLAARDGLRNAPPFAFNLMGGALPAGATFQRASTGWAFGPSGVLTPFANDVPRFSYTSSGALRGLWNEPAATNLVRNNSGVGAVAPSTPPNNWTIPMPVFTGLNCTVVGPFTESGISGVDIRYQGTRAANSIHAIDLEPLPGFATVAGDVWSSLAFAKFVSVTTGGIQVIRTSFTPLNAAQGALTGLTLSAFNGIPTGGLLQAGQFSGGVVITDPLTVTARPRFTITILAGDIDLVLRLGLPAFFKSASAGGGLRNSPIPTTTAAVTRAVETLKVPLPDGTYTFTLIGTNQDPTGSLVISTVPGVIASGGFAVVPNSDFPLQSFTAQRTS